jgi:hypothetical protein
MAAICSCDSVRKPPGIGSRLEHTFAKDIFAGIDPTCGDAIFNKEIRHVVSNSSELMVQVEAVDCK